VFAASFEVIDTISTKRRATFAGCRRVNAISPSREDFAMKGLKSARQRFKSMHSESFVIPKPGA
jgi:hypothetical protein